MLKTLEVLQALVGSLVALVVVFILARRALARARGGSSPRAGNVMEVMDEVFSPARHVAALELRAQQEQGPTTPVPDEWPPRSGGSQSGGRP